VTSYDSIPFIVALSIPLHFCLLIPELFAEQTIAFASLQHPQDKVLFIWDCVKYVD
jgi:hypothetical protein